MRRKILITLPQIVSIVLITILLTTISVLAASGTTDATNAPGLSASYTLEDIYVRLVNGTAGSQSTFNEPAVAPGTGTMHDLNDIMAAAPAVDNVDGATANHVLATRTFWGLTNGQWGLQTGNIPVRGNVTGSNGARSFSIPDGYYSGRTATAQDSDLLANNILAGKNIFGVAGKRYGGCVCNGHMVGDSGTRWCDNEDGTITDMQYGCLIWTQNASCIPQTDWLESHFETQFLRTGRCELTDGSQPLDWRLPTYWEMGILMQNTDAVTNSNPQGFSGVQADWYWTVAQSMQHSDMAMIGNLSTGAVIDADINENHYVWAVRNDY